MDSIVIEVTGHPVAQSRPRMAVVAGHARAYKAAKSRRWEEDARQVARQAMVGRPLMEGCLELRIIVFLLPPKSWPAWKRKAAMDMKIEPTTTPDLSNYVKGAEDAFNGIVWRDDAQIVNAWQLKRYSATPSIWMEITPRNTSPAQIKRKSDLNHQGAGE